MLLPVAAFAQRKWENGRIVPTVQLLLPPGNDHQSDTKQQSARRHIGPNSSDSTTAPRTESWGAERDSSAPDRESGRHVICPLAALRDVEAGHLRLFIDAHADERLQDDGDDD